MRQLSAASADFLERVPFPTAEISCPEVVRRAAAAPFRSLPTNARTEPGGIALEHSKSDNTIWPELGTPACKIFTNFLGFCVYRTCQLRPTTSDSSHRSDCRPFTAIVLLFDLCRMRIRSAQELGITALHIKMRATGGNKTKTPGPGAQSALRALARAGMKVITCMTRGADLGLASEHPAVARSFGALRTDGASASLTLKRQGQNLASTCKVPNETRDFFPCLQIPLHKIRTGTRARCNASLPCHHPNRTLISSSFFASDRPHRRRDPDPH